MDRPKEKIKKNSNKMNNFIVFMKKFIFIFNKISARIQTLPKIVSEKKRRI